MDGQTLLWKIVFVSSPLHVSRQLHKYAKNTQVTSWWHIGVSDCTIIGRQRCLYGPHTQQSDLNFPPHPTIYHHIYSNMLHNGLGISQILCQCSI